MSLGNVAWELRIGSELFRCVETGGQAFEVSGSASPRSLLLGFDPTGLLQKLVAKPVIDLAISEQALEEPEPFHTI